MATRGNHDRDREKQGYGSIDVLDRLNYCELLDPSGKDISGAVYKLGGYNFVGSTIPEPIPECESMTSAGSFQKMATTWLSFMPA